jgi:signal transduction histidine kinase
MLNFYFNKPCIQFCGQLIQTRKNANSAIKNSNFATQSQMLLSIMFVTNALIRKKLNSELEKENFLVAIIGGIIQLPWIIVDGLLISEFWLPLLLMRIFSCLLPIVLFFTYQKIKLSPSLCLFLLVMSISFTSFYAISHLEIDGFRLYTNGIITFFLATGMLVVWELKYSIIYLVLSIILSILLFYLNSPLTSSEIFTNGGFAFYTIGMFSAIIIYIRYRYRINDLKTREELTNSIDELNLKSIENKVLYDKLQMIDKTAIVNEMTSSIAHELNTPLAILKNSSAILIESFQVILKSSNQGVDWTSVNYVLLKLADRRMFNSYFNKIQESERISDYLEESGFNVSKDLIILLTSTGIKREDTELLEHIFKNENYTEMIQLIYQLRIIDVMNNNILSSVNKTSEIIHELRAIQQQTVKAELRLTNLKLTFDNAVSIFQFQTSNALTIKILINDVIEIHTSKFRLIQLWVKLFEFINLSNDKKDVDGLIKIKASIENSYVVISFHLSEGLTLSDELLNNVNSIFQKTTSNQIDPFNLNIIRSLISNFKFEIKIQDNSLIVLIPNF